MKLATLQLAPQLGDVDGNIKRANAILERGKIVDSRTGTSIAIEKLNPDVLVLPELALTG